jgi:hypothetical protein
MNSKEPIPRFRHRPKPNSNGRNNAAAVPTEQLGLFRLDVDEIDAAMQPFGGAAA